MVGVNCAFHHYQTFIHTGSFDLFANELDLMMDSAMLVIGKSDDFVAVLEKTGKIGLKNVFKKL